MITVKNKIMGSIYGFAIGDAIGATTEFMSEEKIKSYYGEIKDMIGGGWLNLKAGEITDDTQMTICVMDALINFPNDVDTFKHECAKNFLRWYLSMPKDIGCQCAKALDYFLDFGCYIPENDSALGNGSLMRAMPCALLGKTDFNVEQGKITHNNIECSRVIQDYTRLIQNIIYNNSYIYSVNKLFEPSGYIFNTFNNAMYWSNQESFEKAILGAVNHGGDADTIAAITGSIAGARFGYDSIPQSWIEKLDSKIKECLEKFKSFVFSCL